MKTSTAISIAILIIVGAGYFVMNDTGNEIKPDSISESETPVVSVEQKNGEGRVVANGEENSVIKDGVQYVTITAHGGYSPRQSTAKAGIPTKLLVKTSGTYDCSASLVIHSLNYRKMLPNTGETVIDAGTPKVGDTLQGVCSMGMYSFVVTFK